MLTTLIALTPVGPDAQADSVLSLDPFTVSLLFGAVIPIIGGVILKASTSGTVKAIANLVMSAIAAAVNVSMTDGGGAIVSEQTLKSTGLTFLISIATLYGVWKPTGVDATLKSDIGLTDKPGDN
jgi:hypothetical protein